MGGGVPLPELKERQERKKAERELQSVVNGTNKKPMSPALEKMIREELQRKGALPPDVKPWDPKDNPRDAFDISSLRGGARELWHSRDFLVALAGPSETGKTYGALKKVNALLWKYPGAQWVMLRLTYSSCIATCLLTYKRIVGENSKIKAYGGEKPEWFDYPNGSRLWVGGLDNLAKVLSGERDGYYINQAEELGLDHIETITTRATGRGAVMPYTQVIVDANPGPPSHWIVTSPHIRLLESRHEDNPTLFDFAPDDVAEQCEEWPDRAYNGRIGRWTDQGRRSLEILGNLTGLRRDRLFLGKWVQAEGVVYDTFDYKTHTVPDFKIPKDWRRIRVIDFGYENPFVCQWWAIDPDGRMYLYREIYLSHVLVSEIARDIRNLSVDEKIECTICDHDAEDRATLAAEGIRSIPAWKKVSPGIQAVQDSLKVAGDGRPRLMILRGALDAAKLTFPLKMPDADLAEKKKPTRTAEEFTFYVWAKDQSGKPNKEEPVKEFDHGMDACRYACAYVRGLAKKRIRAA